nr:DUF1707 domain-containing protein [Propionicimonas sp.]
MAEPGYLRIGNAERREAIELLQRAGAEGRLSDQEVSERSARVQAALTYADLDLLFADLPVTPPSRRRDQQFIPTAPQSPGWSPGNRLVLSAGMSRERRRGRWEIPPYLRVSGDFGSVVLDCREAVCLAPVVDIDVLGGAGSVRIIVPDGWGVDTQQVTKGWGTVRNRADAVPGPGQPLLVLHGSAGVGSLKIRPATSARQRRRQQRQLTRSPQPQHWVAEHPELPNADDLR